MEILGFPRWIRFNCATTSFTCVPLSEIIFIRFINGNGIHVCKVLYPNQSIHMRFPILCRLCEMEVTAHLHTHSGKNLRLSTLIEMHSIRLSSITDCQPGLGRLDVRASAKRNVIRFNQRYHISFPSMNSMPHHRTTS